MIRRKPTRIELRLEDIKEWEDKRREEQEARNKTPANQPTGAAKKDSAQERHERIGYFPQPRIS